MHQHLLGEMTALSGKWQAARFCVGRQIDRTPEPGLPAAWRVTHELDPLMASQCISET
jgi:hypothetical protein